MRLTIYLMVLSMAQMYAVSSFGQKTKLDINMKQASVEEMLRNIESNSTYRFFYRSKDLAGKQSIDLNIKDKSVLEILDAVLPQMDLSYEVFDNYIAVKEIVDKVKNENQQIIVKGKVTDTDGNSLPGVNVIEKGTTNGSVTNLDGEYTLSVTSPNTILAFSYVGYLSEEVAVDNQTTIDMTLIESIEALDEVVVIGYGTQRKRDITSAISIIDVNDLGDIPVSNASRLLQGQAAGVVVNQLSGTPGEQMNVTIRGVGSIGAGSDPLYVIDGFAVGTSIGQNINPNDIESISVLKDAASTAIYGARGSNGVILITTKNAKDDELSIIASVNYGVQNIPDSRRIKMMNGPEFANFLKESWMDKIRYYENREPSNDEVPIGIRYPEQTQYSTDWFGEILNKNAAFQDYNLTLATGKGKIKSLISAGYLNQEGALIETDFERYTLRANITGEFNDYISTGFNLVGAHSGGKFVDSNGRDQIIGRALWADPRDPIYNEDGTYNDYIGGKDGVFGTSNPVQEIHEYIQKNFKNNLTANTFVEISFLKDFKFKSSFSASLENTKRNDFRPSTLAGFGFNNPPPQNAFLKEWYNERITTSADQLLTYSKIIADKHQIEATFGYSAQESTYRGIYGYGTKFPNNEVQFLQQAENTDLSSSESSWSLLAYFARLNYSYNNKYLLSASYRSEGSSRFGSNNKWGDFPAVSVGWRISEEPFMTDITWLTDLKIRGSYGITGNNEIGEYKNSSSLSSVGYVLGDQYAPGVILSSFVNENIGWEESNQLDLGLDLSIFDNKLVFTAEYYKKLTNNMLLPVSIPVVTGFTSSYTNVGKVQNLGTEFALTYKTRIISDLNFRCNFNIAFNKNEVLEIDGQNDELWSGGFYDLYNVSKVGRPISMIYGYKVLGIFNTDEEIAASPTQDGAVPGVYKYYDATGDGVISYDTQDMVEIGNPWPKYTWGLTLGADYKNFDLNILFTGAMKYDLFRQIEKTTLNMDGVFNIVQSAVDNRFRTAEEPGDGVIPTSKTWKWERESNSRYVYDASHAWVKSITFGYTLSNNSKILESTRFYLTVDNLVLVTKYPGSNPEINTSSDSKRPGWDDEAYPVPRTISVGANIKL